MNEINTIICENESHDTTALLEYGEWKNGMLYICPECGRLYAHYYEIDELVFLGDEYTLISNIDSPNKDNSNKCKNCGCASFSCGASFGENNKHWYYCPVCTNLDFI